MAVSVAMFRDFKWSNGMWEPSENDCPLKIGIESSKSSRKSTLSMPKDPRQRRTPSLQSHWRASSGCFFPGGSACCSLPVPKKDWSIGRMGEHIYLWDHPKKSYDPRWDLTIPEIAKKSSETTKQAFWDGFPKMRWEPAEKWGDIWCHPRMRV